MTKQQDGFGVNVLAGSFAGFAELTLGGNILAVKMANKAVLQPLKIEESRRKGFLYHYYGRSYAVNLVFRVPLIASILGGVSISNQLLSYFQFVPTTQMQVLFQSLVAGTVSLPISYSNERFMTSIANHNASISKLLHTKRHGFRGIFAIWLREVIFIAGPVCSSACLNKKFITPYLKESISETPCIFLASSITGFVSAIVSHPFHLVAVNQLSSNQGGFLTVARQITRESGHIKTLFFRGITPRITRMTLLSGVIVWSSELFKSSIYPASSGIFSNQSRSLQEESVSAKSDYASFIYRS